MASRPISRNNPPYTANTPKKTTASATGATTLESSPPNASHARVGPARRTGAQIATAKRSTATPPAHLTGGLPAISGSSAKAVRMTASSTPKERGDALSDLYPSAGEASSMANLGTEANKVYIVRYTKSSNHMLRHFYLSLRRFSQATAKPDATHWGCAGQPHRFQETHRLWASIEFQIAGPKKGTSPRNFCRCERVL